MATTAIEWTATVNADGSITPGRVWNPVTGCHKVSPGCKHCYAEGIAKRFWRTQYPPVLVNPLPDQLREGIEAVAGQGKSDEYELAAGTRPREFGDVQTHTDRLTEPFLWKKPYKVFVNSMSDLFEEAVPFEFIDQVFAVMALCPHITFIVLTKRAERMREYIKGATIERIGAAVPVTEWPVSKHERETRITGNTPAAAEMYRTTRKAWPLPNVWLGVSVENQKYADERIPQLLQTPAAVRFLSCEPLLEGLDISKHRPGARGLGWVIVGGESGPGARPCQSWWIRNIVGQCRNADVPVFVKQLGADVRERNDADFDGSSDRAWPVAIERREAVEDNPNGFREEWQGAEVRIRLIDRKGGDMAEWPEDLRVRQFPEPRA